METWAAVILAAASMALSAISIYIAMKIRREVMRHSAAGTPVPAVKKRGRRLKRYLVFRVYRIDASPSFEELETCIKEAVKSHLGLLGYSETSIKLIRYRAESGVGVLRIVSREIHEVVFSISTLRICGGKRILISPLKIAGTAKSAYRKISVFEKKYS